MSNLLDNSISQSGYGDKDDAHLVAVACEKYESDPQSLGYFLERTLDCFVKINLEWF